MKKWNLVVDVQKCFNCNNCALAAHDEYYGNEFPGYAAEMPRQGHRWIDVIQRERGAFPMVDVASMPVMCNHCDDAPCLKAARNGAVTKRADGIVIIDPEKAVGQRQLVEACPYGAIWWNEEKKLPQAWPFDAHLLDAGWTQTRASQVCPTEAVRTLKVDDGEMRRIADAEGLEVLKPELGTRPRVYYRNLKRFSHAFVGGSVVGEVGGVAECLARARVSLSKDGRPHAQTDTDAYGDFRFEGLPEDSGDWRLEIQMPGFEPRTVDFSLDQSTYLGVFDLEVEPPAASWG
jgi:Fe-S-cluster-containing dehydrogenase component